MRERPSSAIIRVCRQKTCPFRRPQTVVILEKVDIWLSCMEVGSGELILSYGVTGNHSGHTGNYSGHSLWLDSLVFGIYGFPEYLWQIITESECYCYISCFIVNEEQHTLYLDKKGCQLYFYYNLRKLG